ncbi:MAG: enoyl-CoA hydratase-related protein, partial [Parasphingorhabdus sp.]
MVEKKYECFDVEIENGIAHIRMNRPEKLNSMNRAFWNDLPEIVEDIDINARARAIVISSTGKHFSAGMDLSVFAPQPDNKIDGADKHVIAEMFRSNVKQIQHSFNALEESRIPVLFALHGAVIGGAI